MGYAGKRLNPTYALAVKPLYLSAAVACPWIPAGAGMTVSEEIRNSTPYLVIPAQTGTQKGSGHYNP